MSNSRAKGLIFLYMCVSKYVAKNSRAEEFFPTSDCQYSGIANNNPIIRNFCISEWIAVPINPDKWSSALFHTSQITY